MSRTLLNLGILAHVDAGKTTLTERLLYAAGVIDELGSVDDGNTQTDTLALERQRGITIKSAVVSFVVGDVAVNLIDTPGHPDFIAEVERVLSVLDGAVLVISAVEGVQPQTRLLMRALQRLRVPTLLFVNKIDRRGADVEGVLGSIRERLTPAIVAMGCAHDLGTPIASFTPSDVTDGDFTATLAAALAENDDALLAAYVDDEARVPYRRLRDALADQTARSLVYPVYAGSALTGAGVDALTTGIVEFLPAEAGDAGEPVSGTVFKVERGRAGEKVAYVRMFSGTVKTRDRVRLGDDIEEKVTAIRVFEGGAAVQRGELGAGEIGKLWGLGEIRIGDAIGTPPAGAGRHHFAPPTLETVVVPGDTGNKAALRVALAQLAEQDPLIDVRQDDTTQELSVSLYGEVQKEVIQATLAAEYGIDIAFREATPICVERPSGTGEAIEVLHAETNPFHATIGLRVEPVPDAGVVFRLDVDPRTVPLYVYKTLGSFTESMDGYVRRTLREGLFGWQVTDCVVTMTSCVYSIPDGPPSRRGPPSTAADFRKLTPLVLMQALEAAGTLVCEPVVRASIEVPTDSIGSVLPGLARLGAAVGTPSTKGMLVTIEAVLSAARAQELQRQLPRLTGGEGVMETEFAGYEAVGGPPSVRPRTTVSPLDRAEYLMALAHRVERHT
jgi:ribosomal protection tetracycline resistance protein